MKKEVIVCLDDEKIILDGLKSQLRKHFGPEYSFEFAESADECFEVLQEYDDEEGDVVMVISDWLMPGMKGDEFLIKLHQNKPDIVKVMLTGQADEDAIQNAYNEADLYRCLSKPWKKTDLISTIENGLAQTA